MKIGDFGEHTSHVPRILGTNRVGLLPVPLDTIPLTRSCARLALLARPARARLRPGPPRRQRECVLRLQVLSWGDVRTGRGGVLAQLGKRVPAESCPHAAASSWPDGGPRLRAKPEDRGPPTRIPW